MRQPKRAISATANTGVKAPPRREPACVAPCAKPRSAGSIQRESERVAMGKAPASPIPKRNRHTAIDIADQVKGVKAVKADHQITTPARARRAPSRSPNQ